MSCCPAPSTFSPSTRTAPTSARRACSRPSGAVGMGTTTPLDRLHVRYDNNTGQFTGFAVQNTNGGALAYSGMLFYDHTNALTQFQGYNNSTHEYRINNIARVSPGGAFNGTINFMIGGTSRFFAESVRRRHRHDLSRRPRTRSQQCAERSRLCLYLRVYVRQQHLRRELCWQIKRGALRARRRPCRMAINSRTLEVSAREPLTPAVIGTA